MGDWMRFRTAAALAAGAFGIVAAQADGARAAEVVISINKSTQSMSVLVDGVERYHWVVSTGLGGGPHDGSYRAGRMERSWYSRKYNMAPMPHSIFFDGNYAIHGTYHIKQLGRRASKGCVRLHPANAAKLFELVRANHATTTVVVSNSVHVAARPRPPEDTPALAEPEKVKPEAGAAEKRAELQAKEVPSVASASGAVPATTHETTAAVPPASAVHPQDDASSGE
jgi:hypothetical protein